MGKRITYAYDVQGNRRAVTDADNVTTAYAFDARNRLATVTSEAGVTTYAWWEDDLLKSVAYPNGTLHDRSDPRAYDRANRILAIVNRPAEIGGVPFSTYRYTYDRNGNRLSQVETQRSLTDGGAETTSYVYDNLDRLIGVTYATTQIAYTYDAAGNRLTERGTDPPSPDSRSTGPTDMGSSPIDPARRSIT